MKYFFIFLLLFFYCFSYSQLVSEESLSEFIEVRVHTGYTVYGTTSYKLMYEGLIYRKSGLFSDKPEESKFIPMNDLDINIVVNIQNHLRKHGIYRDDFQPRPYEDTMLVDGDTVITEIKTSGLTDKFVFIDLHNDTYKLIYYKSCDKKVETLIDLLNALIPESDRERFGIKNKRCKHLHWYRKRSKG